MDADFLAEIEQFETEVNTVTSSFQTRINEMSGAMRTNLSAVLAERQALCDKIEGFWTERFVDPDGPLLAHFNGTTDQRIARAVTSFTVPTEVTPEGIVRKFVIALKPNIAIASSELFLQVDQSLKIVSTSGIQWKPGTEKTQKDSFFRIFDASFNPAPETPDYTFLEDVVVAFEELYQDPFNDDIESDGSEGSDEESDYDSDESAEN